MMNLGDMFGKAFGNRTVRRKMTSPKATRCWSQEEADKLLDKEAVNRRGAMRAVEQNGIVFLDEIDKVCAPARMCAAPMSAARACSATCCR
jgi:ATP-dependent HslUV protease ATP-binding subunit HslU